MEQLARRAFLAAFLPWLLTRLPFLLWLPLDADTRRYEQLAVAWLAGRTPYAEVTLEYPPLSLVVFTLASVLSGNLLSYVGAFKLLALLCDALVLLGVFRLGSGAERRGASGVLATWLYTLLTFPLLHLLLRRNDIFAAATTVWAVQQVLSRRRVAVPSVLLAVGACIKLVPAVLLPLVVLAGWRLEPGRTLRRHAAMAVGAFAATCAAVLLPFLVTVGSALGSVFSYHAARPLQVESTYASVLMLLHRLRVLEVAVNHQYGAYHLVGPLSETLARGATVLALGGMALVLFLAGRAQARAQSVAETRESLLAGGVTLPLALLVTSKVLSPQYLVWLLPFLAPWLVSAPLPRALLAFRVALLATVLSAVVYPLMYAQLLTGELAPVLALLARNAALVVLLVELVAGWGWLEAGCRRVELWWNRARWSRYVPGALVLAWAGVMNVRSHVNADLWIHLKIGADILRSGTIPGVDAYSAVASGRPFVAHEWLAGVLFELVHSRAGAPGLTLVVVELAVLMALALLLAVPRGRPTGLALLVLFPASYLVAVRVHARPHLFSLLITALLVYAVESWREHRRWRDLLWLLPVGVLWANLHGGYLLGPVLLCAVAATCLMASWMGWHGEGEKPWTTREALQPATVALGLLVAALVNPYGPRLLMFSVEMFASNAFISEDILEWLPFWAPEMEGLRVGGTLVLWLHPIMLALMWLGVGASLKRLSLVDLMMALVATVLSLRALRFTADFALLSAVVITRSWRLVLTDLFRPATWRCRSPWAALAAGMLVAATVRYGPIMSAGEFFPLGWGYGSNYPVKEAEAIREAGYRGAIFNEYTDGSYLVYALYPDVKPVVDSRIDVLGAELWREYSTAKESGAALLEYLERHDIGAVLLSRTPRNTALLETLQQSPRWKVAHVSQTRSLFLQPLPTQPDQ
ncbi:MAG: hypothetical protein AB2A00_25740 [Myxococcota bacterium]